MKTQPYNNFYEIYKADRCKPLVEASGVKSKELEMYALGRLQYPGKFLNEDVLRDVFSIGYWDAKKSQSWGLNWHRNEGIEITYLASGSIGFSLGRKSSHVLKPGNLTVTRPWQLHKVGDPNVATSRLYWFIMDLGVNQPHQSWKWPDWIILSKNDLNFLTKVLRQNELPVWDTRGKLEKVFKEIGKCLVKSQGQVILDSKLKILINEVLLLMLDVFREGKVKLDESLTINLRTVEIFLDHLRTDYERNWTLDEMALHCNLGITSLTKYFKQLTNLTPINYLNKVRLEAAAQYLHNRERTNVSSIGYDCGFSSSQYFATAFKRMYNLTPLEYRRKSLTTKQIGQ
ncbi:AraC family transcriptional regulator [Flagellimonas sp. 2504JD4-2]